MRGEIMNEKKDCIFCKIARKEIPSCVIYEDKDVFVFLDSFPCVRGQALVIPKKHIDYFINLNDSLYKKLMLTAKKVASAIQKTFNPVKVGVIIEGLEVNHAHIKLYPLGKGGFAEIIRCKPEISKDEMCNMAKKIKSNL